MFVETKCEGEAAVIPSAKDVLIAARAKIADPKNWCQGSQGLDARGIYCHPYLSIAVRHCALGALSAVVGEYISRDHPAWRALGRNVDVKPHYIGQWNNSHSHAEVIGLFDRTIAGI